MRQNSFFIFMSASAMIGLAAFFIYQKPVSALDQKGYKTEPTVNSSKLGDPLPKNLFIELNKAVNPSVVSITTTTNPAKRNASRRSRDPLQEFLEDFWGGQPGGPQEPRGQQQMTGLGTGFIIRDDGLIVTNNHVVEQADVLIKVQLDEKSESYDAEIVGRDSRTDLALLKIKSKAPLKAASLGSSQNLEVGAWVAAFGNPYGHAHTMTKGIISAIGRSIKELNRFPFIQTDASINPGNSGGPLVNTEGQVIGVNTAIDARAQGVGFAIPIDNVKTVIAELEKTGRIKRGFIGVELYPVTEEIASYLGLKKTEGVLAVNVLTGSPAALAGLKRDDIIVKFGDRGVNSPAELLDAVADSKVGDTVPTDILSKSQAGRYSPKKINIKLVEAPDMNTIRRTQQKAQPQMREAPQDLGFRGTAADAEMMSQLNLKDVNGKAIRNGIFVSEVAVNSAVGRAGLQAGDVIYDVNGKPVTTFDDLTKALIKGSNLMRVARGQGFTILIPFKTR